MTKHQSLLIISHTEHFLNDRGIICGWGSTVREIDHLATVFKEVRHIGFFYNSKAPQSALEYEAENVTFIPVQAVGGKHLLEKVEILLTAPKVLALVKSEIKKTEVFHFRAPTGIGVFLIPYLSLFTASPGWYKYAGSWVQKNIPISYRFQRWFLNHSQKRPVTINGKWPNQKAHTKTFENPCLTVEDRIEGSVCINEKCYTGRLEAIFVGRLEQAKGVDQILNYLRSENVGIDVMHFVGDGPEAEQFRLAAKECKTDIKFYGFLSRNEVKMLYKKAHFLFLPSETEGFPKVIAEGANYGCIPIVSDISSIGQYVTKDVGFLWNKTKESFGEVVTKSIQQKNRFELLALNAHNLAGRFTYERYIAQVQRMLDELNIVRKEG
ncbi:MAG TPA: capsular biosynthesis protein [Flavobacteriales bacterium]|jgi:glycosyltransferase involved in cell wall biosynthesis|nr:capsular biosynthesis protein [Flavobacteriales bacterium]